MASKVLIVDDHQMFREGIRGLLQQMPEIEIIGEASNGHEAINLANKLLPDVILMDIAMPGISGIETISIIHKNIPECSIIAISMHADSPYVASAIRAGAVGYVLKDCAFADLLQAIQIVGTKKLYLSSQIAQAVFEDCLNVGGTKPGKILTAHEHEVLGLIAKGRSTKEIAGDLDVSVKTIETHRKHIMDKLNLYSIAELTKYALREGLTEPLIATTIPKGVAGV